MRPEALGLLVGMCACEKVGGQQRGVSAGK